MAVLSHAAVTERLQIGNYAVQTFRATAGAAAADEWIATGFTTIVAVLGYAVLGATDKGMNFQPNARGTGVTEGTNPGDLGCEQVTGSAEFQVTVLGRP